MLTGTSVTIDHSVIGAESLRGSVGVHNHPVPPGETMGDSFSRADLIFSAKYGTGIEFLVSGSRRNAFQFLREYTEDGNSGKRYFDVQETLRIHGIDKGIALPPIQKKAFILPDGKYDPYHIMHRMMERQITDDQIRGYIKDAKIMFVQWNGQRQRFVGVNGTCVITKSKDGWIFKTA